MTESRIQSIDLVKTIAMIAVMGLHTSAFYSIYSDFPDTCGIILFRLSACCMPLFFMVSGYLLLGRTGAKAGYGYSMKKILSIVRFVAVFTVCATLLLGYLRYDFRSLGPVAIINTIVYNFLAAFIQKGEFQGFWFFGSMILIYLLFPVVNKLYTCNIRAFAGMLMALFFVESVIYTQNITYDSLPVGFLRENVLEFMVPQPLRIWTWLFYFMLGGLFRIDASIRFLRPMFGLQTVVVTAALNVGLLVLLIPVAGIKYNEYFYSSFFVIAYVSAIFINVCSRRITGNRVIAGISKLFLPVYALHGFVIEYLNTLDNVWRIFGIVEPIVFLAAVSCVTLTLTYFLMKIPLMRKLFAI